MWKNSSTKKDFCVEPDTHARRDIPVLKITRFIVTVDDHALILCFHIKIEEKLDGAFL